MNFKYLPYGIGCNALSSEIVGYKKFRLLSQTEVATGNPHPAATIYCSLYNFSLIHSEGSEYAYDNCYENHCAHCH